MNLWIEVDYGHCLGRVKLRSRFTVKAVLRKKGNEKKGYTSSINFQLTDEEGFTKRNSYELKFL